MEGNKDDKQQISQGNIINNSTNSLSKILSPYLPKDVLEEIDIVDSSKTNSLSKNSSGKSTKSQTNNNNGNNNNSDSNNSGSNNNKGNNSDTSGNSKNDISNINLRKVYHSYPKNDKYQIKHKIIKYFLHETKYQNMIDNNHNLINIRRKCKSSNNKRNQIISKNSNSININNKRSKHKKSFNKIGEKKLNQIERNNIYNSDKNLTSRYSHSKEKNSKHLNLIYSHPNLSAYKKTDNIFGFNELNQVYDNNMMNGSGNLEGNHNIYKIYNINSNNIKNNGYYNRNQNKTYQIKGSDRYIISNNNSNVNKSHSNFDFGYLFQNKNMNGNLNHSFNYVNNINNDNNYSINGNEINLYNKFPKKNDENTNKIKDIQNLFYNLNPYNNRNNNKNNYINSFYMKNNNNEQNKNNKFSKPFNINNNNNINFNENNINNNFPKTNYNYQKNLNNNKKINYKQNQNFNIINNIINNKNINNNINDIDENNNNELSDTQIDYLFNQLYSLPKEGCILLYIINKKGVIFFINLTKTIKGSKYLQNIMQIIPPKEIEIIYITKIICANYKEIMCDYYGNYFLQKFFPFCNHHQRIEILISIKNDFINIANDICGNHSLQCLISLQNTNEEKELIRIYTQDNLKDLCIGGNSSHVIIKIIKFLKESERQYINNFIVNDMIELCIDSNGICVLKEFIYNIKSDYYIKIVLALLEKETKKLTFHQFGNYIIQEVIRYFGYNYCKNIIDNLINNLVEFSLAKFSSNVIDFLIEYLSKKQFWEFCNILRLIFLEEKNFKEMIKNKFSIYVIENCLELLIKINENYFINSVRNNLGHSKKINNEENNIQKDDEFSFENFLKLKKQIFQFIENNSAAKEKKKILALIKSNRHKRI